MKSPVYELYEQLLNHLKTYPKNTPMEDTTVGAEIKRIKMHLKSLDKLSKEG